MIVELQQSQSSNILLFTEKLILILDLKGENKPLRELRRCEGGDEVEVECKGTHFEQHRPSHYHYQALPRPSPYKL
jgi:hypothetical protein